MVYIRNMRILWLPIEIKWRVSKDHSKLGGFQNELNKIQSSADEEVWSVSIISLSFPGETNIEVKPLVWSRMGVHMMYVDLKSACDKYADGNEHKEFLDMGLASSGPLPLTLRKSVLTVSAPLMEIVSR